MRWAVAARCAVWRAEAAVVVWVESVVERRMMEGLLRREVRLLANVDLKVSRWA